MNVAILWYLLFSVLLLLFAAILFLTRDKRYFYYFLVGSIFGFYFDLIAFSNGIYSYPSFYTVKIFGLPLSMTIAEGFSVAILIFAAEKYIFSKMK